MIMFPFSADHSSLHLFDKPFLNRHDALSSHSFPLSPLNNIDHDVLFNDITSHLAPPPQISSPPPPPPQPPTSPPNKPSSTHKCTNPSPRSAAFFDLDKRCAAPAKRVDGGGGAVGRRLRKDRHSKIYTAQGPRDRRMRLSLDVARKFFDLQDTLGFDKASKTVDWLLSCCKSSIMELTGSSSPRRYPAVVLDHAAGNAKSESSTSSECEVCMSVSTNHAPPAARAKSAAVRRRHRDAPAAHPPPSREKRQMARARARERTKKNKMLRSRQFEEVGGGQRSKQPPASSTGEDSAGTGTHTTKTSCRDLLITEEGQLITTCSPDQCKNCPGAASQPAVAIAGGSSAPISILDYSQNIVRHGDDISFVEKHHSWDMIPPTGSAEEQRVLSFADHSQLQLFLWEAFQLIPSP